jgi:hypothetical protein
MRASLLGTEVMYHENCIGGIKVEFHMFLTSAPHFKIFHFTPGE